MSLQLVEEGDGSCYYLMIDDNTDTLIGMCSVDFAEALLNHSVVKEDYDKQF